MFLELRVANVPSKLGELIIACYIEPVLRSGIGYEVALKARGITWHHVESPIQHPYL
jgi:hypothetical protein